MRGPMPAARRRPVERLSAAQARRIALAAQGFADPRPGGRAGRLGACGALLDRVGLRADRLGQRAPARALPAAVQPRSGRTTRRCSTAPPTTRRGGCSSTGGTRRRCSRSALQPLLRWRMERAADEAWGGMRRIRASGPSSSRRCSRRCARAGRWPRARCSSTSGRSATGPWWDWSDVKRAFEWLFWSGQVTSARRRGFERLYDLPERVLPAEVLAAPTPAGRRTRSASCCASPPARSASPPSATCATTSGCRPPRRGRASPSSSRPASCGRSRSRAGARPPTSIPPRGCRAACDARALVGPFDSLIWERARAERLFGFRYRIEIYVPAPQRVHGYYVLPFLLGDRLVARVDLKADRQGGVLRVQAAHAEPDAPPETAGRAAGGARVDGGLARARRVEVVPRGDLAPAAGGCLSSGSGRRTF